jgi:hypothetical protein
MAELAEGARLEIVCTAKSGTEGSNPSLSAKTFYVLKWNLGASHQSQQWSDGVLEKWGLKAA